MTDPLEPVTLAHKIAAVQAGAPPTEKHVERVKKNLGLTYVGAAMAVGFMLLAWKAMDSGNNVLAGVFSVASLFAAGIMDRETLLNLAAIPFRRKE